ncbi:MAG: AN1-type zinc finger domain-containing protein [Promethearchaeota archaeon]
MSYCEFCGEKTGALPFKCSYCGGNFCGKHRLPENHDCSFDVEYRNKRIKEKEKIKERYRRNRDLGARGERRFSGTLVLYALLLISSIIAYFYPYYMCISYFTSGFYSDSFIWTIFTSIFVIYFSNPIELAYFIILLVCSYYYIRTIENKYGPKLLLFLFVSCSVLGGLLNLFLSVYVSYINFVIIYFPIGLASGGLLGVNVFLLLDNPNKNWYFFRWKLKGKYMLLFLAIINVIAKGISSILIFTDLFGIVPEFLVGFSSAWYIFDLFGLLGAVIIYALYFRGKY